MNERFFKAGLMACLSLLLTQCNAVYSHAMMYLFVAPVFLLVAWAAMHFLSKRWNRIESIFVCKPRWQLASMVLSLLWLGGVLLFIRTVLWSDECDGYYCKNSGEGFPISLLTILPNSAESWLHAIEFFATLFLSGTLVATRIGLLFRWRYTFVMAPMMSAFGLSSFSTLILASSDSSWIHHFAINLYRQTEYELWGAPIGPTPWGWFCLILLVVLWVVTWFEPNLRVKQKSFPQK